MRDVRNWKFSARVTPEHDRIVLDILRAANRYYNHLVEIERSRYERFVAVRRRYAPELAAMDDAWTKLDENIVEVHRLVRLERARHWQASHGDARRLVPEWASKEIARIDAEKKHVSGEARALRVEFRTLVEPAQTHLREESRRRADGAGPRIKSRINAEVLAEMLADPQWPAVWRDLARSDDQAHDEMIAARATCGLSTGTYLAVEDAFARAKKDSSPRPPRFHRFDGEGKIALQLRAATFADVDLTPIAVDRRKPIYGFALDQSIPRSGNKRAIACTVLLHRRPPADAAVKWISIVRRRTGRRVTYELQLTMEHASFREAKRPAGIAAPVHVRLGWGQTADGVRVATWPGGDVVVSARILSHDAHAAAIEGHADAEYDRVRRMLRLWMRNGPHRLTAWHRMGSDHARGTLRRVCEEFARWVMPDVDVRWRAWRAERKARKLDIYARPWALPGGQQERAAFWLYLWSKKDAHLCEYAAHAKRRARAQRDDFFRREAIRIATASESATVDKYSIAQLKERPALTVSGEGPIEIAQHNVQAAAPGRFREILLEVMGPRCVQCERPSGDEDGGGARVVKSKGKRTQRTSAPSAE